MPEARKYAVALRDTAQRLVEVLAQPDPPYLGGVVKSGELTRLALELDLLLQEIRHLHTVAEQLGS